MIKGLDNYVSLNEASHTYTDTDGKTYMSVSAFRDRFKTKFDPSVAYSCAGKGDYIGMSPEEVLKQWDDHRDGRSEIGTRIHNAFERYEKTTLILPEDVDLTPMVYSVCAEYRDYYRLYQEQIFHFEGVAGTGDKVCVTSSHKDSPVDFTDYKTNAKGVKVKDIDKHGKPIHKYFLHCLSHLLESKYSDYALQLSIYAYMFQKQTGRRVGSLRIHFIDTENPLAHYFIPVPYMFYEVEAMFKWHRENPVVKVRDLKKKPMIKRSEPVTQIQPDWDWNNE